jgi:hypothetical protein
MSETCRSLAFRDREVLRLTAVRNYQDPRGQLGFLVAPQAKQNIDTAKNQLEKTRPDVKPASQLQLAGRSVSCTRISGLGYTAIGIVTTQVFRVEAL